MQVMSETNYRVDAHEADDEAIRVDRSPPPVDSCLMTVDDLHGIACRFACAADEALYEAADLIGELAQTVKDDGIDSPQADDLQRLGSLYSDLILFLNERRLAQ